MHNFLRGHVVPWWTHEHQVLDYLHESFNSAEDLAHWSRMGFTQTRFTGDLYDMRFEEPDWIQPFRQHLPMQHFCWSVYRMRPGDVLPEHGDTYTRFRTIYHIDHIDHIMRYVVFLEDWQSGHYFEIDSTPVLQWQAGDWVCWRGDTTHIAANLGASARYTLQLTGLVPDVPQS